MGTIGLVHAPARRTWTVCGAYVEREAAEQKASGAMNDSTEIYVLEVPRSYLASGMLQGVDSPPGQCTTHPWVE